MSAKILSVSRARQILNAAAKTRVLVVGDVMLDQFIWGSVARISPEAPVPVVDFERESFMPGGAANVARNLTALNVPTEIFGAIGHDDAAHRLEKLLVGQKIGCSGLVANPAAAMAWYVNRASYLLAIGRPAAQVALFPQTAGRAH